MKKILLLSLFVVVITLPTYAQFWVEAGLKGMVGTTVPYNKNTFGDDGASLKLAPDFAYGAKLAMNFGENNGVTIDGLMSQTKADYQYDVAGIVEGSHQLAWKNIEIYPLFRHYYERSFIEIGPKISLLNSVSETNTLGTDKDVKANFRDVNYGATFGFGGYLLGGEGFSISMNVRFDYNFSDFVSEAGQKATIPGASYPLPFRVYDNYAATNPITARIGLELTVPLGGVARAQCGQRVFFMGGNR